MSSRAAGPSFPVRCKARPDELREVVEVTRSHFPERIRRLPPFDGPFDAFRLPDEGCEVLFASYPSGTVIEIPSTATVAVRRDLRRR